MCSSITFEMTYSLFSLLLFYTLSPPSLLLPYHYYHYSPTPTSHPISFSFYTHPHIHTSFLHTFNMTLLPSPTLSIYTVATFPPTLPTRAHTYGIYLVYAHPQPFDSGYYCLLVFSYCCQERLTPISTTITTPPCQHQFTSPLLPQHVVQPVLTSACPSS